MNKENNAQARGVVKAGRWRRKIVAIASQALLLCAATHK
jgi:hypothetical protein